MKYHIIRAAKPDELIHQVTTYLNLGWKPQGGICCDHHGYVMQAMILPEKIASSLTKEE